MESVQQFPQPVAGGSAIPEMAYPRRKGAANELGTQFEYKMATLIYLRALQLGVPFRLSTNDARAGDFDDLVLEYGPGGGECVLLLQLKHKGRGGAQVTRQALAAPTGHYSLNKYFESYRSIMASSCMAERLKRAYFVLFTNAAVALSLADRASFVDTKIQNLLNTGGDRGTMFKINIDGNVCEYFKEFPGASDFLNKFIVCCNQATVCHVDQLIKQEVLKIYKRITPVIDSVCNLLVQKVYSWWKADGGQNYLTESWSGGLGSEIFNRNELLSKIKFLDDDVLELAQLMYDSECSVMSVVYEGVEVELRSLKIMQALTRKGSPRFLFVSSGQSKRSLNVILDMWEGGWCDSLVIDSADNISPQLLPVLACRLCDILEKNSSKNLVIICGNRHLSQCLNNNLQTSYKDFKDTCGFQKLHQFSRKTLFDQSIILQGHNVFLHSLDQNDVLTGILNGHVLSSFLIHQDIHIIGSHLTDVDDNYIPRTVRKCVTLKKGIVTSHGINNAFLITGKPTKDLLERASPDQRLRVIFSNETELERVRKQFRLLRNTSTSLHWIEIENGTLHWMESHGDPSIVCENIEASERDRTDVQSLVKNCMTCSPTVDDLMRAELRTVIVTGEPGMGKSVLLTVVARKMKQLYPSYWVLRVCLNDVTEDLLEMKSNGVTPDGIHRMLANVADLQSSTCPQLARALLQDAVEFTGNVCLLFDSFDEISPLYKDTVLHVLRYLHQSNTSTLWVSSRPVVIESLVTILESTAFVLQPFTDMDQITFFAHHWGRKYAEEFHLIMRNKLYETYEINFYSIPLHTMMIVEAHENLVATHTFSQISEALNFHNLYNEFIRKKFFVYCNEKSKMDLTNAGSSVNIHVLYNAFLERHMLCALVALNMTKDLEVGYDIEGKVEQYTEAIQNGTEKTGIIDGVVDNKPHFIHQTFEEYFAALWLAKNQENNFSYIRKYLFESRFSVIKSMFELILAEDCPVHLVVLNDDLVELRHMLEKGDASVLKKKDAGGRTLLHLASQNTGEHATMMVDLLLNHGADIEAKDALLECTALGYAAKAESWATVIQLLGWGARVENDIANNKLVKEVLHISLQQGFISEDAELYSSFQVNWRVFNRDMTILHLACLCSKLECVKMLVKQNADLNVRSNAGISPLHCAVEHVNFVKLLVKGSALVNAADVHGCTPLHYAASLKCVEVVHFLLQNDADVNMCSVHNETALHVATKKGKRDILRLNRTVGWTIFPTTTSKHELKLVQLLLDKGADTEVKSKYGNYPLHIATREQRPNIVKILLEHGASANILDMSGETPLFIAGRERSSKIVKLLLNNGAEMNVLNRYGDTPLHMAARSGRFKSVLLMLRQGACVAARGLYGDTPLHIAARKKKPELAAALLAHGADVEARDRFGNTPLLIATSGKCAGVVKLLVKHGADAGATGKYGDTALDMAARWGYSDIVKLLKNHEHNIIN